MDPKNEDKYDNEVDAIAGSTITGDGVTAMIRSDLSLYQSYFNNINSIINGTTYQKKTLSLITDPLSDNNPITVQVLGICSALAITAELRGFCCYVCFSFICNGSRKRCHIHDKKYCPF